MSEVPASVEKAIERVPVWDLPTRIFHWLLVVLVGLSFATGWTGGDALQIHQWSGITILVLLLFRVAWGFIGGRHARFVAFVRGPVAVLRYARGLGQSGAARFVGHNPLGGWSVLLMLLSLFVQVGTGLFAQDEDLGFEGPLAARVSGATSRFLTHVHHVNLKVLYVLLGLHVLAILFYLVAKRENLVLPMITGAKPWQGDSPDTGAGGGSVLLAAVVIVLAALAVLALLRAP